MGAGASSKGKSPGSTAPKISEPPQIGQIGQNEMNLGSYESQFINEPLSLGNWAMNIATGGTGPQVQANTQQGGTTTGYFGTPGTQSSNVQSYAGGGGTQGGTGGSGAGYNWGGSGAGYGGGSGAEWKPGAGLPKGAQVPQNPTAPAGGPTPQAGPPAGGPKPKGAPNLPTTPPAFPGASGGGGGSGGLYGNMPGLLGGFSSGENAAWNVANQTPAGANQIQGDINQAGRQTKVAERNSQQALQQANQIYNKGQWLTPQQEAMINQQTAANQAQVAQTEGSMGLSGSTQAAQLAGETAQAGLATKGQLQQGNMQAAQGFQQTAQGWTQQAQNWQNVAQGFTALGMGEQKQAFDNFTSIAQLGASEQGQMFQEGTAGYQLMQTFMSAVLQPYNSSVGAFNDILQANTAQVGDQVGLQSTAISADQSGQNQVISGISSVLSSLVSSWCWVAREVYGVHDPRWMQFRFWMLNRSPGWFRKFYLTYGERIALWISDKPLIKRLIRLCMNLAIKYG